MSEEKNRKRSLSSADNHQETKRRSICEESESNGAPIPIILVTKESSTDEDSQRQSDSTGESHDNYMKSCDQNKTSNDNVDIPKIKMADAPILKMQQDKGSVSDSVFSDGSVIRSVSEYADEDSDDPLDEYETQYFGFTPKSFMNGVYNALAEYIRESLAALAEYIKQQFPQEMTASQLQEGEENMMKFVLRKLNRSFDILEQYLMTNVFKIPSHVVLPEDEVQVNSQFTEEEEKGIDTEIKHLEDKILTIRYANGILRQDLVRMDEVQEILESSVKQLESMEELTKESKVSEIRNSTIDVINRVKKLINIVQTSDNIQS